VNPEEYRRGKYVWSPGDIEEVDEDEDPTLDQIRAMADEDVELRADR
jgi:hypothetical protein